MSKRYLEFYDNTKTYIAPSFEEFTPERVMRDYAVVNAGVCVVETNSTGKMFYSVNLLDVLRDNYDIDENLSETEALASLVEIVNMPPAPASTLPTPEERIAAALEFQNVMTLPEV